MKMKLGSMTFGEILDRGIKMFLGRFPTFFTLGFLLLLPLLAIEFVRPEFMKSATELTTLIVMVVILVLNIIFSYVYAGAVVDVIARDYLGKPVSIGTAVSYAFKRFGTLFGSALMAGIIIFVGLLLLVIPGIIFAIWYAFITQVVMVEGLGGGNALTRSKQLTEGHRGRIFGILFFMGLVFGILSYGLVLGLNSALPVQQLVRTVNGLEVGPINYTNFIITVLVQYVISIAYSSFQAICVTLMYFDLRVRKEGFDLEVMAAQSAE